MINRLSYRLQSQIGIALLAFCTAAPSLLNGFAYDDLPVIANDDRIHHLNSISSFFTEPYWKPELGARLYRPLTSLAFALEWQLGHGEPWLYHAVNMVLYALACVLVYRLAVQLLGASLGWWAAALFAVHPVHVEAVANSVGQAELWAALFIVALVERYVAIRRTRALTPQDVITLTGLYLLACLFKEHALMAPALLVAMELTILPGTFPRPWDQREGRLLAFILILAAIGFWTLRTEVVGNLVGDRPTPGLFGLDPPARLFTMLGVVPQWARLIFFPVHLQADYLPQEIQRAESLGTSQLIGIILLVLAVAGAISSRQAEPVVSFALLWMGITLFPVSNTLVISGVLLAERTLFLPSAGAILLLGALGRRLGISTRHGATRKLIVASGAAVLVAGAIRSGLRARVWRDNDTLFAQMLIDAPLSYRAHYTEARRLATANDSVNAEREYRRALALFPYDAGLQASAADLYSRTNRCEAAVPLYRRSVVLDSTNHLVRTRLIHCLVRLRDLKEAQAAAAASLQHGDLDAREDSVRVDSLERSMQADTGHR